LALLAGLGLALLALGAPAAGADAPPLPDRNPQRSAPAKPLLPGEAKTIPWSNDEIEAAKEECRTLLAGLAIDYEALAPIKEGLCGAPAPILVRGLGDDPKVTIDPPATVSCPLAKALVAWINDTVQAKAKAELGSTVVGLRNATSYACRNRYGGERTPISEHALANALDISEFVLDSGKSVTVLKAWPVPLAAAAAPPVPVPNPERDAKDDAGAGAEDQAKAKPVSATQADKPAPEEPEAEEVSTKFVRAMHDGACKAFGTVLGPAANAAHRDHFHFDMKKRRQGFCE
jgi:hypothetical protein